MTSKNYNPIFIIGQGRTGSKLLIYSLNKNSDIYISPELKFLEFWKKCVSKEIEKIGNLNKDENAKKAIDMLFSKNESPFNKFYEITKKLDVKIIMQRFLNSKRNIEDLLMIFLKENTRVHNKKIWGAKFPVHFSYLSKLLKWFPESKIIFLIRHPAAIINSEIKMKSRNKSSGSFPISNDRFLFRISIIFYVVVQWIWSLNIYEKNDNKNLFLLKYEDLLLNPESIIRDLCFFIGVDFDSTMLDVSNYDSSYSINKNQKGFNKRNINLWRSKKNYNSLCKLLCIKKMNKYGYK